MKKYAYKVKSIEVDTSGSVKADNAVTVAKTIINMLSEKGYTEPVSIIVEIDE
mgnify:CR=1 FL=1